MKPKIILILEDDLDIRQLLWKCLEKEKYQVLLAKDGEEGLEQAEKKSPDLVILDLMLPRQDGLSVLRELRKALATASIPVLILTAKGDEADRVVGLELGADDYVSKPFSPREVAARVKALLRRVTTWGFPSSLHCFIVKHIAEAHNGRVEVHREVGQGSRFTLILPQI